MTTNSRIRCHSLHGERTCSLPIHAGSPLVRLHVHRSIRNAPELTPVAGKGDGTVSVFSGEAPREAGVKASFRHGSDGKGTANIGRKGYDHQGSYNDTRAQWAALYGIIKITQLADWHPNDQS